MNKFTKMSTLTKSLVLVPAVLLLSACETKLEGTINLSRELIVNETIKNNGGDYPGGPSSRPGRWERETERTLKIQPGSWAMSVMPDGDRKVVFQVKDARKKMHSIVLKVPRGGLSENSGSFYWPSSVTGQPFDINGVLNTTITDSELMRDYREMCSYSRSELVCGPTGRGGQSCWTSWRTVSGTREVEFFNRTETRALDGEIFVAGLSSGTFTADHAESSRVYTYEGVCY